MGKDVIGQITQNADIARNENRPICQDTGMTVIFMESGQDVHFAGGDLEMAVNAGVVKGYIEGHLHKPVVDEPLFRRTSTTNNTPSALQT
ncbi:MAG: fumarate hydratase [Sporomusa sp.]